MEIQKIRTDAELLDDLVAFDPCLQDRITQIQNGLSPNGQNPDGVLGAAMEPMDPENPKSHLEAENSFIKEYEWAIALFGYAYAETVEAETFRAAAVEGLFMAGESYNPKDEPDFLRHLTGELGKYLFVVFGEEVSEESMRKIPALDEFEALVRRVRTPAPVIEAEAAPDSEEDGAEVDGITDITVEESEEIQGPTPSPGREPSSSTSKQKRHEPLPSLAEARAAKRKEDAPDSAIVEPLPEPRLPHERLMDEFRVGHRVLFLVGAELKDAVITDLHTYGFSFVSSLSRQTSLTEIETLSGVSERKLKALREEPWPQPLIDAMISRPDLHRFIPPSGFVRVKPEGEPTTTIIDSNRSEIIPLKAWERLMHDDEYREAWLASGPTESLRLRSVFEHAMERRRTQDRVHRARILSSDDATGRARFRSIRVDRETGARLHTATGN